ncbi:hypothetical protein PLESTF_000576000 [Pleodorina starrii]|nr:hypothetical protein PLESTF_000576000 [Pleodorina starrii]
MAPQCAASMHNDMRSALQQLDKESTNLKLLKALPARAAELRFSTVVNVLESIASYGKLHKRKVARIRRFFSVEVPRTDGDDLLQLFRLLLPKHDFTRGYFGIKEKRFAGLLATALGACRQRAEAAKDWMRLAHQTKSKFPTVMQKVLLDHYCPASIPPESDTLTVGQVNAALDQLAAIASGAVGAAAHQHQPDDDDEHSRAAALRGRSATAQQQQAAVLGGLLRRCTPRAAWWLICIVLREELPLGLGNKALLNAFHPDAHDAFNSCSDLRLVLDELCRPGSIWRRRDVEPGLNVAPQLADRVGGGPQAAAGCMSGRPFLVETKFDGWRIQLHVTGDAAGGGGAIRYFSRNVKDHGPRSSFCVLDDAIAQFLRPEATGQPAAPGGSGAGARSAAAPGAEPQPRGCLPRVVLDGEMLVWNKTRRRFEPFGMLEAAIRAAAEGLEPQAPVFGRDALAAVDGDDGPPRCPTAADLEVLYVAFDILYLRDTSVVHLPLRDRKKLLASVFRMPLGGEPEEGGPPGGVPLGPRGAVTFRAEALLPERPMFDGKVHSWSCSTPHQAQQAYDLNAAAFEEGIVVKALEEPYHIGGRTKTWIKIKPDYLTQGEFDAVIVGQKYDHCSTNRVSAGGVYLLGLPEEPPQPGRPTTYVTFATVGIGLTREQRRWVLEPRLAGNMAASPRDVEGGGRAARLRAVPGWCRATGCRDEWPDWWVVDPEQSVVVQVNADVRLTRTANFAAGYTTRFPRITRIRVDKSPREATSLRELRELVRQAAAAAGGAAAETAGGGAGGAARLIPETSLAGGRSGGRRSAPPQRRQPARPAVARVPLNLLTTDTSEVPVHFDVLAGAFVVLEGLYGAAVARRRSELSRLVRQLGGRCSANYVPNGECRTSYVIVDEWVDSCHGRDTRRDLLRPDWLEDCYMQRRLIWPPKPAHAWRLSQATLAAHADQVDAYGDPYYELLDEQDLAAVLDWHVGPAAVGRARQVLTEATAGGPGQRHRRRRRDVEDRMEAAASSGNGVASLPADTAAGPGLLHWLDAEMRAVGEEPPTGLHRVFGGGGGAAPGCVAVHRRRRRRRRRHQPFRFAARGRGTSVEKGDARRDGGALLLQGVNEGTGLAARWAAEEARQQLQELRLAVLRGGGQLAGGWSPAVTHVVLYDGAVGGFEEAGARMAGAADGLAGYGGGVGRDDGDTAAAAMLPPAAPHLPRVCAEAVLAALQSKCAQQHWDEASAELLARAAYDSAAAAAATAGVAEAACPARSSSSSRSSNYCYCCQCSSSDDGLSDSEGEAEDDDDGEDLASRVQPKLLLATGTSAAGAENASRGVCGPLACSGSGPQVAACSGPQRVRWRWGSELARLLRWLGAGCGCGCGCGCGGAQRIRGAGPAGGVRMTDWRWIRDCLREAERATAAAGRDRENSARRTSSAGGRAGNDGEPSNQTAADAAGRPLASPGADTAGEGAEDSGDDEDGECGSEDGAPQDYGGGFVRLPEALYPPRLAPPHAPWCRPHALAPSPSKKGSVGDAVALRTGGLTAAHQHACGGASLDEPKKPDHTKPVADLPAGIVPPVVRQLTTDPGSESPREPPRRPPHDPAAALYRYTDSGLRAARGTSPAAKAAAERPAEGEPCETGAAAFPGAARASQPAEEAVGPPGPQVACRPAGLQVPRSSPPGSACRGVDTGPAACGLAPPPGPSPHGAGAGADAHSSCGHTPGTWSQATPSSPPAKPRPCLGFNTGFLRRILDSSDDDDDDDDDESVYAGRCDGVAGGTAIGLHRAHPTMPAFAGPGRTSEPRAPPAQPGPTARTPGTPKLHGQEVAETALSAVRTDVPPLAAAAAASVSSPAETGEAPPPCQLSCGHQVLVPAVGERLLSSSVGGAARATVAGAGMTGSERVCDKSYAVRVVGDSGLGVDAHPQGVRLTADDPPPDTGRGEQAACGGTAQQQQQLPLLTCRDRAASGRPDDTGGTGARCAAPDCPLPAGVSAARPSVMLQEAPGHQPQWEEPVPARVPAREERVSGCPGQAWLGSASDSRKRLRGPGGEVGSGGGCGSAFGSPGQASSLSGSGGNGPGGGSSGRKEGGHRGKRRRRSWLVVFEALTAGDDTEGDEDDHVTV